MSAFFMARSGPLGDAPLRRLLRMALLAGGGASGAYYTLTGTLPMTLPHSLAAAIRSLTRTGSMTQSPAPTPSAPVYPVINNGAVQMVDDELPAGYKRLTGLKLESARFVTDIILTGASTLRFSASGRSGNWIGSFSSSSADDNYSFYATTNSGGKYLRYDGETYNSSIVNDTRYDIAITPTGITGNRTPSTWVQADFVCSEPLCIGAISPTQTPGQEVTFYSSIFADDAEIIPCERESDGVLGYFANGAFLTDTAGGTVTSLGYDTSHLVPRVVGAPETLSVDTQTATVPNLYAVGDYRDEVDVVSGTVTRRVGCHIFDGTEAFTLSGGAFRTVALDDKAANTRVVCSHFDGDVVPTMAVSSMPDLSVKGYGPNEAIFFKYSAITTVADFKSYLAAQYAAGTPVIVWYPLTTPTTESLTTQALRTVDGTTIVSSSAGSVGATVEYKASEEPASANANTLMMAAAPESEDGGAADGS